LKRKRFRINIKYRWSKTHKVIEREEEKSMIEKELLKKEGSARTRETPLVVLYLSHSSPVCVVFFCNLYI
jgi:hypothetical protein